MTYKDKLINNYTEYYNTYKYLLNNYPTTEWSINRKIKIYTPEWLSNFKLYIVEKKSIVLKEMVFTMLHDILKF